MTERLLSLINVRGQRRKFGECLLQRAPAVVERLAMQAVVSPGRVDGGAAAVSG